MADGIADRIRGDPQRGAQDDDEGQRHGSGDDGPQPRAERLELEDQDWDILVVLTSGAADPRACAIGKTTSEAEPQTRECIRLDHSVRLRPASDSVCLPALRAG